MSHAIIFVCCLAGFAALALGTERQQLEQLGRELPAATARMLRMAGWIGLAAGGVAAIASHGWSLGLVIYSGHTSLCAGLVFACLIALKRRAMRRAARAMGR